LARPRRRETGQRVQALDLFRVQRPARPAAELTELDRPEAHADDSIHGEAHRAKRRAQLAMAAFAQNDVIPAIVPRAACVLDRCDSRNALIQFHANL
jgi:hypothetical protein